MSSASRAALGQSAFHAFTREMWIEFKVAADYATGMSNVTRATPWPPSGFVQNELGFAVDGPDQCGPGCRCTALRPARRAATTPRRRRTGRDWQEMVSGAATVARRAA